MIFTPLYGKMLYTIKQESSQYEMDELKMNCWFYFSFLLFLLTFSFNFSKIKIKKLTLFSDKKYLRS
jgi:hypothetical protein